MTWVDLVVFGFLAISGLLAFARGFVREVLGLAAWVGAVAAGIRGLPVVRPYVAVWFPSPTWLDPVSFCIVFLVTLIVLIVVAGLIGSIVRRSVIGGVDRTLGLVFGLARGAAVVIIAYIFGQMLDPIDRWPESVLKARLLMPTYEAAVWVREQVPEDYRPHKLDAPPEPKPPTAEALLRANPQGRATGKPPARE